MTQLPVIVGLLVAIFLPLMLFAIEFGIERKAKLRAERNGTKIWWSLKPQKKVRDFVTGEVTATNEEVDFEPRHGHYLKCGEIVIALASASLVFIPTLHFTSALPWLGLPIMLLGSTVVYALAFIGLLTYFYEMELQDPDSFTMFRSCTIFSLGFAGLGCFAVAYFALSFLIGVALSKGVIVSVGH